MKRFWLAVEMALVVLTLLAASIVLSLLCKDIADLPAWVQAVGSIAAILAAIWVMIWQNKRAIDRDKAEELSEVLNVLHAIQSELHLFPPLLQERTARSTEVWPSLNLATPIYTGLAAKIGMLENNELRSEIIKTYSQVTNVFITADYYSAMSEKRYITHRDDPIIERAAPQIWKHLCTTAADLATALATVDKSITKEIGKLDTQRNTQA